MNFQFELGNVLIDVVLKKIKNIYLSVHPPHGTVRISAPRNMKSDLLRVFAISKLEWILRQQKRVREQEYETPREYLNRESHYVWGKRYLLKVIEDAKKTSIELQHSHLVLNVTKNVDQKKKEELVEAWYRAELRKEVEPLISQWTERLGTKIKGFYVQQMKTRWGSCNPRARTIRLNTELAKKPKECLEYVLVHELAHLFHTKHNQHFFSLMDKVMPKWRSYRQTLNEFPLTHQE